MLAIKPCYHYQGIPSKICSKKAVNKKTWSKSSVVNIKVFLVENYPY